MFGFLKNRAARERSPLAKSALGRLETNVMEVLWDCGESDVRAVVEQLDRALAYTTVMTTLDRLFKKHLLNRHRVGRSFVYSAKLSRQEWRRMRVGEFVTAFLTGPEPSRELLISSFVDVLGEQDAALLEELERKVRMKRKELFGRRES